MRALKLWAGEVIAAYLIGRVWLELVDLTAQHVRKQPPTLTIEVTAADAAEGEAISDLIDEQIVRAYE